MSRQLISLRLHTSILFRPLSLLRRTLRAKSDPHLLVVYHPEAISRHSRPILWYSSKSWSISCNQVHQFAFHLLCPLGHDVENIDNTIVWQAVDQPSNDSDCSVITQWGQFLHQADASRMTAAGKGRQEDVNRWDRNCSKRRPLCRQNASQRWQRWMSSVRQCVLNSTIPRVEYRWWGLLTWNRNVNMRARRTIKMNEELERLAVKWWFFQLN